MQKCGQQRREIYDAFIEDDILDIQAMELGEGIVKRRKGFLKKALLIQVGSIDYLGNKIRGKNRAHNGNNSKYLVHKKGDAYAKAKYEHPFDKK